MERREVARKLERHYRTRRALLRNLGVLFCASVFGVANLSADFNSGYEKSYEATDQHYPEGFEHDDEIDIGTFNIAANNAALGALERAISSGAIPMPDAMCLQEITSIQADNFAKRHPDLNVTFVGADNYVKFLRSYLGNMIVSPYKLQNISTRRFEGDIEVFRAVSSAMYHISPELLAHEGYKEKRAVVAATIEVPISKNREVKVRLSNTHIDGGSLKWRQRRAFGDFMEKQAEYQVDMQAFCGDLNATNRQDVITMVGWDKENIPPSEPTSTDDKRRIDYIGFRQTLRGLDRHLGVATLRRVGSIISIKSDHYASLLSLEFKKPQGPDSRKIPHLDIS